MSDCGINRHITRLRLPIRLAPIAIDDWSAVRYVHAVAFERLASPYLEPNDIELFRARLATPDYTDELMEENLVGAWVENELAGTAGWRPADDNGTSARITSVFVLPVFAGFGIGAQLLVDAESRAEAAGFKSFAVRATPNAVGFFELFGYEVSSHGIHHLMPSQDVPVTFMRKRCSTSMPSIPAD